jgi:hypothetical protein
MPPNRMRGMLSSDGLHFSKEPGEGANSAVDAR